MPENFIQKILTVYYYLKEIPMSDKKLPLPKLAIFDMDGLLFDTEALFQRTKAVVMKKYGYEQRPGDYEKTLGTCGDTLNRILHELYGEAYPADTISQETRSW